MTDPKPTRLSVNLGTEPAKASEGWCPWPTHGRLDGYTFLCRDCSPVQPPGWSCWYSAGYRIDRSGGGANTVMVVAISEQHGYAACVREAQLFSAEVPLAAIVRAWHSAAVGLTRSINQAQKR